MQTHKSTASLCGTDHLRRDLLSNRWSRLLLLLITGIAPGCSSSVETPTRVTVLVTNQTCAPGPCAAIRVLAFPDNQPNTPGGAWSLNLGVVSTASACVVLPPIAAFYVIAEPEHDTTTFTWTTARHVTLGGQPEAASTLHASSTTDAFVAMSAAGWSVELPGGTRAVPAAPCTP